MIIFLLVTFFVTNSFAHLQGKTSLTASLIEDINTEPADGLDQIEYSVVGTDTVLFWGANSFGSKVLRSSLQNATNMYMLPV